MHRRAAVVLLAIGVAAWAAATAVGQPGSDSGSDSGSGSDSDSGSGSGSDSNPSSNADSVSDAAAVGSAGSAASAAGEHDVNTSSLDGEHDVHTSSLDGEHDVHTSSLDGEHDVHRSALDREEGFRFGSYGRILAGTDLRGGKPEPVAVVAHGPRVVEASYLELDLQYRFRAPSGRAFRTVTTLAFDDTLFHATGEFDAHPALRNLFGEAELGDGLTAWVGSRMYRGDDIYLFDYWPLDDQNTVGAGARYQIPAGAAPWVVSAHVGWNRLTDEFQYQEVEVSDPEQGATTVTQLNRQRTVASATLEAPILAGEGSDLNLRGKLHAELQILPSGTRQRDDGTLEELPADTGYTVGFELSAFGLTPPGKDYHRHANLFARYSRGLAAFDELAPPTSFDNELKTTRASEAVIGLSAAWDHALGNAMLGVLARRFIDADRNTEDLDDGWEYAVAARPLAHVWRDVYAGADLSYQVRFPRGLNPTSQLASDPAVVQIAPMITWSPMGPSAYSRPQLRLVYRAAHLNDGARDLYAPDDPRRDHEWVHYLGVQAEWWFNSASYR